ncbi:MAG: UDP-galactopyranose mutase [Lachnospiraceae bacterium]|nr:UDP-galactopyranose mutase [Lachnospiraceae bacterium]
MWYDALIVGAGLYGCTYANRLASEGARVLVIDRRSHIAGNAYVEQRLDIPVHVYGAHIFHTADANVWEFVQRFSAFNRYTNSPIADYHGEIYNLPFNMNTFSRLWGVRTPEEAREKISAQIREAGITGEPRNLEEQALSMAGRDIYEKLIKGYTEKQWGRPCDQLPAFILRRVPFRFTYDNNYFSDPYQGIPVDGYTELARRMLEDPATAGRIDVRTGVAFADCVELSEEGLPVRSRAVGGFRLRSGDAAGRIVYTGRIDEFFGSRLGALEYRSLRFETEELPDIDDYQGNAVVNYTAAEVPYTRVIEHRHFVFGRPDGGAGGCGEISGGMLRGTVITREYPETWQEGAEPYYPVNDEANNRRYEEYAALAEELEDVSFGGRLGKYKYYNMDQVIAEALADAEHEDF